MTPPVNTASLSASAGWRTLLHKEVQRFWKVAFQTIAAPVLTAVLYLLVFGHVLDNAGVFKWDEAGRAAQQRFIDSL